MGSGAHQPALIPSHSAHVLRHCLCAHWWRYLALFDNYHLTRKNARYFLDSEMGLWWGASTAKLKSKHVG